MIMVDELQSVGAFKRAPKCFERAGQFCHMTTDGELGELHEFAERLGMRRSWFQEHASAPHYDLTPVRRLKAIQLGATVVPARTQALARLKKRGLVAK